MKAKSIITVSGRICAGKSFAANLIKKELGFPIASFGGYLKFYCERNNLSTDRKTLQDTGETFVKTNPKQFSIDVITHFIGSGDILILEGVRHKSIFDAIKQLTENHLAIFAEADLQTRYKRWYDRNKDSDTVKTYEQFLLSDNHPVEQETESLKQFCNIVVDSTKDYSQKVNMEINKLLHI